MDPDAARLNDQNIPDLENTLHRTPKAPVFIINVGPESVKLNR